MEACRRTDSGKCWLRRPRRIDLAWLLITGFGLTAVATVGTAQDAAVPDAEARLEAFNADVETLTARFSQETWDVDGDLVDEAEGDFALMRPGRFRWHTESPYDQLVVADGKSIWMYDVELEQATRTPIDDISAANPGFLLSGERAIRDDYDIGSTYELDDREYIELLPKDPRADFSRILIAFNGTAPVELEVVDGLNQTTRIRFSDTQVNSPVDPAQFEFDPPPSVDVIGDRD